MIIKSSKELKAEGKINTQMALVLLFDDYGVRKRDKDRLDLINRMREEILCVKNGEGKGAFWYFDKEGVRAFGEKLIQE